MSQQVSPDSKEGYFYAFLAYGLWGLVPTFFFKALTEIPVEEVFCHRVVWSLVFLGALLGWGGKFREYVKCFRNPKIFRGLILSTVLVGTNWFGFMYGVVSDQIVQISLGYFINPLVNVLLGMLFFKEKLRPLQWFAVGLAFFGVTFLIFSANLFPWIAFTVAFSFGMYGSVRKTLPVSGLVGLSVEITLMFPFAVGYLIYLAWNGYGNFGIGYWPTDILLLSSGAVTATPLIAFGQATRRLSLTTLGFIQYLAPSLQLLIGVFWYGEDFSFAKQVCFISIWVGLALVTMDSIRHYRRRRANQLQALQDVPMDSSS